MSGKNEIVCEDKQRALTIMGALISEGYVVMMSTEDKFVVINYEWTTNGADRNEIAFVPKDSNECPKEQNFDKCYSCKWGHCDFEPMKNEEYELPEG